MGCYLITRTVLRKGGYKTTHEVGSLARVMSEAQAMVAAAKGKVSTPDLNIDKQGGAEPRSIALMLRTARTNQISEVYQATRGAGDERLPPAARQVADPNSTEASLREFILGGSTPKA
jgi:hypothetical protein